MPAYFAKPFPGQPIFRVMLLHEFRMLADKVALLPATAERFPGIDLHQSLPSHTSIETLIGLAAEMSARFIKAT